MLTRKINIVPVLLSGVALLTYAGCASSDARDGRHVITTRTTTSTSGDVHAVDVMPNTATSEREWTRERPAAIASSDAPLPRGQGAATEGQQQAAVTLVTSQAPPLTPAETPTHEPRQGEFWVAGNWRAASDGYVWNAGRIERDRPGRLFVPAGWVPTERGWEFTPEYWR